RHLAPVPHEPDRDGVRLQAKGQFRRRERARDHQSAQSGLRRPKAEVIRFLLALLIALPALADVAVPPPQRPGTDLTATLKPHQAVSLRQLLRSFEPPNGSPIP